MKIDFCKLLKEAEVIAVVGFSGDSSKTSRRIAEYLNASGYKVYGVNPNLKPGEISGICVLKNLKDIPEKVDIVDVFRKSEAISEIVPDVLEINPKILWLQQGIRNDKAVKPAIEKGIITIQDRCIFVQHKSCF